MKTYIMLIVTASVFALFLNACEKTDYQHPLYRKQQYEQNKRK